jgi:hypothetical protein
MPALASDYVASESIRSAKGRGDIAEPFPVYRERHFQNLSGEHDVEIE